MAIEIWSREQVLRKYIYGSGAMWLMPQISTTQELRSGGLQFKASRGNE
jgi:hypothetical protein